ncbi:carboxymuconolactone decarboxylase family protein [Kutzneria sp. NPDC052558]|uniref:carboxymuconolactone decarboxylase family protein n=1 Tax=Kutzneria sp. NPDC052558 TaxID=3364121 RepID=UPI0037C8B089
MAARMTNPAKVLPDTVTAVQGLFKAIYQGGVPKTTLDLVHLRASQINGCGYCVDSGVTHAQQTGETVDRLLRVAAWRESDLFTDAERAALALTEAATRMADQTEPVSDAVWDEAADHFDEKGLSALVLMIATTNFFNRINVTVKQPAGEQF